MFLKAVLATAALLPLHSVYAQVTLYEKEGLRGRVFTADRAIDDLTRYGFNDRASSVIVQGGKWEFCEHQNFEGRCTVLRPGQYPSFSAMGLDNSVSSIRKVKGRPANAYAPPPPVPPPYPYYPHHGETLYQANVVAVRAVVGAPEQRCWVEQQQVQSNNSPNIGGAIVGGIL
ncbi:MAG: beta/gamma crystallin family protein, partial [Betaproteobacteria bacterium]